MALIVTVLKIAGPTMTRLGYLLRRLRRAPKPGK